MSKLSRGNKNFFSFVLRHKRCSSLAFFILTGNLIMTIMLAFAEYERGMIVERTQTGKMLARQNSDFRDGRPKKYSPTQLKLAMELLESGKSYKQVQLLTGISKSTLIREKRRI